MCVSATNLEQALRDNQIHRFTIKSCEIDNVDDDDDENDNDKS